MSYGGDIIYLYDGSFEGLLTSIFESYYNHVLPAAIEEDLNIQNALFCEYVKIETDFEKAERVSEAICGKISHKAWRNIYYTYLSDIKNKGRICLDYIRAGFKLGANVDLYLYVDYIAAVLNAESRVRCEAHSYLGFVRFSELEGGIYYSGIEPNCHVLPVIASHFVKRLPGQPWMIHDLKRNLCVVYNGKECYITSTNSMPKIRLSENETQWRRLWKKFYDTIEERHNERCRMSHMPKRLWKHLTELNNP